MLLVKHTRCLALTVRAVVWLMAVLCAVVAGLVGCTEVAVLGQVATLATAPACHTLGLIHFIKVPAKGSAI